MEVFAQEVDPAPSTKPESNRADTFALVIIVSKDYQSNSPADAVTIAKPGV